MSGNSTIMDLPNYTSPLMKCSIATQLEPLWTFTAFAVTHIFLLLPLLGFVLFSCCQRRLESSSSTSSHSDVFTYNMVAMEMIQILANTCFCINIFPDFIVPWVFEFSLNVIFVTSNVKHEFQMLTCVELYFAVVFPITYLRHKTSTGVTIRNIGIGFVWLNCILWAVLTFQSISNFDPLTLYFLHIAGLLFVICFCCISVLWTLKQRGQTRDREQVDQSKLRAFYTILVIITVLFLSLGGVLVCQAINNSIGQKEDNECFSAQCAEWMSLPSSFVLPLLFLQRAGKLPHCKRLNK